jgi:hypothetical protein
VIGEEGADGGADRDSAEERRRLIEAIQQEDEPTPVLSGGDGGPHLVPVLRATCADWTATSTSTSAATSARETPLPRRTLSQCRRSVR